MATAKRPDVFSQVKFQESLRRQGCPESFVSPVTSDFRIFVPMLLLSLGKEKALEIMELGREELGLNPQSPAWSTAFTYIVGWAEEAIDEYRKQKHA